MKLILIVTVALALTNAATAEEWKAVKWTFQSYVTMTGDWDDMEKVIESEFATEEKCMSHLRDLTNIQLSFVGFEVYSELTKFGPEVSGEPFWRYQLQNTDDKKYLESYSCTRTVIFTLIRGED